jgi:hypothetical protein
VNLPTHIPWTYKYNQQLLSKGLASSLIYQVYFSKKLTPQQYWQTYVLSIFGFFVLVYGAQFFIMPMKEEEK